MSTEEARFIVVSVVRFVTGKRNIIKQSPF